MGLARIGHIVNRLLVNGAPAARPVALIAQGTTINQRVVIATLGTITAASAAAALPAPALLIVGDVAALHDNLAWFAPNSPYDVSQTAS
jgi:siroheme synthase